MVGIDQCGVIIIKNIRHQELLTVQGGVPERQPYTPLEDLEMHDCKVKTTSVPV